MAPGLNPRGAPRTVAAVERRFPRDIGSLEAIFAFVDEFAAAERIPPDGGHDVALISEELFTNMVRHGIGGGSHVAVQLEREGARIAVTLRDFDVEPFDPTRGGGFDPGRPIAERGAGGMGLHLVRRLADEMRYDYRDRTVTVTVVRRLTS